MFVNNNLNNMKKLNLTFASIFVLLIISWSPKKPKVLIIGDSISIGYTPFVKKYFKNDALIMHNEGNAQHTGNGLVNIKKWIGNGDWDIIQFNWGLWDLCFRHPDSKVQGNRDKVNGTVTYTVEEYTKNLDSLVTIIEQNTKAKLIFVTTSYVPKYEAGRFEADVQKYNTAAKKIMKKHGIELNEIYDKTIPIHNAYGIGADDVHYSDTGYEKLSNLIIDFLKVKIDSLK